jgi:16S rRNA (cytidine1402-2'-O)-methyltransferase
MTAAPGKLYLIPTPLGRNARNTGIPDDTLEVIRSIRHFAVENLRNAVSFLKFSNHPLQEFEITFHQLDKHTPPAEALGYLKTLREGHDLGVMSDAGCPGIADPGALLAGLAHQQGLTVIPLVGPSSVFLALMASGLNGQKFAFHGYLPIEKSKRRSTLAELEKRSSRYRETQIFMEAPYRNTELFKDLIETCSDSTLVSVACNLTMPDEYISTRSVAGWKSGKAPDIEKKPAIFLVHADDYAGTGKVQKKRKRY